MARLKPEVVMQTTSVDVHDLPTRWQELMSHVVAGVEVIVTEGGVPRARLLPLPSGQSRIPGLHPGAIQIADDFDEPLPDEFWAGSS
jgi:antitoxin (DNA-binding transcriptional repressor) of toxin-antitoxin stability system